MSQSFPVHWVDAMSMKVPLPDSEHEKASPVRNEEADVERWELPVKLKKYREALESYHSREAARGETKLGSNFFHPSTTSSCFSHRWKPTVV